MSARSHLEFLSGQLIVRDAEKIKIQTSVSSIQTRLKSYFDGQLTNHFSFGSYTRGTMLPREGDPYSDVDYMVIFKNPNDYKPQTLLNHLRGFVETYYSRSEIKQSHPTIVLEMGHIRFELVPAKQDWFGNIYIPSPSSTYSDWMMTSPNEFNQQLSAKNSLNSNLIKPLVRLMKYWNAQNNYHWSSFELEKWITELNYYGCHNVKDFVYRTIDSLSYGWFATQAYKSCVDRAKSIVNEAKHYEHLGYTTNAETAIKKLFPSL